MSNLPGNPFADTHEETYHQVGQGMVADLGQTEATLIWSAIENHATATLALAYEQRTATLVHALLSDSLVTDGKYDELQAEVRERLGLGDDND
ncbi:hypothetical protein AOZ07_02845 [Glutamicibacter halophytocola]|uniref:hypothetical protein n=1 Tax=Glutamicibacter halophytocola TaxID=1933880 RepID=UPI0006D4BB5C|nr:hypothetical protein [Glutamicibacter halophytocola]ALG28038.1 hypothetical protein AOZ07_02845 [Glutamicibacter halophytocola]